MALILNNLTSVTLILVCWWLAHQNAIRNEPFRRLISFGYGITAIALSAIALNRNLGLDIQILLASVKAALTYTLGMVSWRLHILDRKEGKK